MTDTAEIKKLANEALTAAEALQVAMQEHADDSAADDADYEGSDEGTTFSDLKDDIENSLDAMNAVIAWCDGAPAPTEEEGEELE